MTLEAWLRPLASVCFESFSRKGKKKKSEVKNPTYQKYSNTYDFKQVSFFFIANGTERFLSETVCRQMRETACQSTRHHVAH